MSNFHFPFQRLKQGLAVALSLCLAWTSGGVSEAVNQVGSLLNIESDALSGLPQFELAPPPSLGRIADYFNASPKSNVQSARPQALAGRVVSPKSTTSSNSSDLGPWTRDLGLVVVIQDLHAHYGVQKNIAQLLEFLSEKLRSGLLAGGSDVKALGPRSPEPRASVPFAVAVEGAEGPIDSSVMALFPDQKIKQEALDYLMRQGELTGMEYFAAMRGIPDLLYGVENWQYYNLHRELFRKSLKDRDKLVGHLKTLRNDVGALRSRLYSPELKAFQKTLDAFDQGEISNEEMAGVIEEKAVAFGIPLKTDFPELAHYLVLLSLGSEKDTEKNSLSPDAQRTRGEGVAGREANGWGEGPSLSAPSPQSRQTSGESPAVWRPLSPPKGGEVNDGRSSGLPAPEKLHQLTGEFLKETEGALSPEERQTLKILGKRNSKLKTPDSVNTGGWGLGAESYYLYLRDLIHKHQMFLAVPLDLARYLEYLYTSQTIGMDRITHDMQELAFRIKLKIAQGSELRARNINTAPHPAPSPSRGEGGPSEASLAKGGGEGGPSEPTAQSLERTRSASADLVQVEHDLALLIRIAGVQATEMEVRDFGPRMNQFIALASSLLRSASPKSNVPSPKSDPSPNPTDFGHRTLDLGPDEIRRLISSSIDYYALALMRNRPMVDNTLRLLRAPGSGLRNQQGRQSPKPRALLCLSPEASTPSPSPSSCASGTSPTSSSRPRSTNSLMLTMSCT